LCYYAYKIINNQESSKDLVQDVFLKFHNKPAVFSSELAVKNFLYLSVKNACLNFLRHDLVEKKFAETQAETTLVQEEALTQIIKTEAIVLIKEAIETLEMLLETATRKDKKEIKEAIEVLQMLLDTYEY
jgi:RNA polymerase sigma-70 factor (ECF subfamily)